MEKEQTWAHAFAGTDKRIIWRMLRRLGGDGVQTLEQRPLVLSREEGQSLVQQSQWVGVWGREQRSALHGGLRGHRQASHLFRPVSIPKLQLDGRRSPQPVEAI